MLLQHRLAFTFSSLIWACAAAVEAPRPLSSELEVLSTPETIHDALKAAHIIPTILTDFTPRCTISITYIDGTASVQYGNRLAVSDVKSAPVFETACPEEDGKEEGKGKGWRSSEGFVVALTDPDAPSRRDPKWSEICHWIAVGDVEGNLTELVEYLSPGPPKNTGLHRYVFVLLAGNVTNLTAPKERVHWGYGESGKGNDGGSVGGAARNDGVESIELRGDVTVNGEVQDEVQGKGKHHRGHTVGVQRWANDNGLTVVGANWFVAEYEN